MMVKKYVAKSVMSKFKRTLNEWLNYIEQPTGSIHQLDRVKRVAAQLNIDTTQIKVITVTGTNGKGSCVEMLTSVYVNAGYRVGTYTSPHLFHFNERIRIQQKPVNETRLCEAFAHVDAARCAVDNASNKCTLTYFEWVTLTALWIFCVSDIHVMLLEVGIGGRLDATNIIDADLAIITAIGLDHMDYLGHTREAIAKEKVGICRPGRWAVCGDFSPPETLISLTKAMNNRMTYIGKDFYYVMEQGSKQWRFCNQDRNIELLDLPYLSVNNAAVALQSVLLMNTRLPVNLPQAIQSILTTTLPGRCEIKKTSNGATIIIDVAHNPHAAEQLKTVLQSYSSQKIIALFSMLQDKAIEETIAVVKNFVHEWHTAVIDHPRHATKAQLQVAFDRQHIVPMWYSDVKTASDCIQSQLGQQDVWVIFGSFFLVQKVYYLL